jgi:hypothetical protein
MRFSRLVLADRTRSRHWAVHNRGCYSETGVPRFRLRYQSTHLELPLGAFSIGRSSKCSLSIADALASRKHAVLHVAPDAVVIEDLDSRNGVMVNGAVIPGRCRLTHLDRIHVGSEELVLVDAAKITDGIDTAPHIICLACGAVNGPAKRHCGDCGKRLESAAGATFKEPTGMRPSIRESQPGDWEEPEDTRTAETRDVIGGIASKAITMGRYDEAERMLLPHMDTLMERAVRQQPLSKLEEDDPDDLFCVAIGYALDLAQGLREPKWIDWVFRMHVATGRLMDAQTIERLHTLVRSLEYNRRRHVRLYLQGIQNRSPDFGPSERFLANRLDGLAQVILARR